MAISSRTFQTKSRYTSIAVCIHKYKWNNGHGNTCLRSVNRWYMHKQYMHMNGWRKTQESSERQWFLNHAVGYVMELHVVIRYTNAPAGSAVKPTHPGAPLCVWVCAIYSQDNTEAASVHPEFAVQERIYVDVFFAQTFRRGNRRRRVKEHREWEKIHDRKTQKTKWQRNRWKNRVEERERKREFDKIGRVCGNSQGENSW